MAKQSINTLKLWFQTLDTPTQQQFWDWIDSFRHKDDGVLASDIDGLQGLLDAKVDKKDLAEPEVWDELEAYVYDADNQQYVSYSNAESEDPQFQNEGFYRLLIDTIAGQSPESNPEKWAYQGQTLGDITINDVLGLQEALLNKIDTSEKGANNGVATLGSDGKVPAGQLPAASGITEIVQDTTPQLGGFLDTNGKSIHESVGTTFGAANNIAPTRTGNTFVVTGSTQINLIDIGTLWTVGNAIRLQFTGTPIIKHNFAVSGTNKPIFLKKLADYTAVANDVLVLLYDGIVWREINDLTKVSASAGHTIQNNSVGLTARTILNFVAANGKSIATDDAGNDQSDIAPIFQGLNDYDATGQQAGDVPSFNSTNDGLIPNATKYDLKQLPSVEPITGLVNTTHTLLSTQQEHGYIVKGFIDNDSAVAITGLVITDGTNNLFTPIDFAANGKNKYFEIATNYFDKDNDKDLYYYVTTGNSADVSIYFLQTALVTV